MISLNVCKFYMMMPIRMNNCVIGLSKLTHGQGRYEHRHIATCFNCGLLCINFKCLLEPGYVLNDDCSAEGSRLRDSGREFYDGKYKSHFDAVFTSIGDFFTAMADDPLNARFGQDWARLTRDLLFDNEGSLKYKPELWNDIRKVIIPSIIDRVGYIPIPRVEYTDDSLDLVLENLTLSGRNLFPK